MNRIVLILLLPVILNAGYLGPQQKGVIYKGEVFQVMSNGILINTEWILADNQKKAKEQAVQFSNWNYTKIGNRYYKREDLIIFLYMSDTSRIYDGMEFHGELSPQGIYKYETVLGSGKSVPAFKYIRPVK